MFHVGKSSAKKTSRSQFAEDQWFPNPNSEEKTDYGSNALYWNIKSISAIASSSGGVSVLVTKRIYEETEPKTGWSRRFNENPIVPLWTRERIEITPVELLKYWSNFPVSSHSSNTTLIPPQISDDAQEKGNSEPLVIPAGSDLKQFFKCLFGTGQDYLRAAGYYGTEAGDFDIKGSLETLRNSIAAFLNAVALTEQEMVQIVVQTLLEREDVGQMPPDLSGAVEEWQRLPEEAREENFPIPTLLTLRHALRILKEMYHLSPRRFEVYPTPDGEVAIEGINQLGQWVILYCESNESALCIFGHSEKDGYKRYKSVQELPDDFLQEVLHSLEHDNST